MNQQATQVSPVNLHHVPNWLRIRCLKAFGTNHGMTDGWSALQHAIASVERNRERSYPDFESYPGPCWSHWLDHWGSTKLAGTVCFVSEPYLSYPPEPSEIEIPQRLAAAINAELLVLPESEWNPEGGTIRLLFKPNE